MKNTTIKDIMSRHNETPIAYYPAFERLTGSKNVALILSQLSYWFMVVGRAFYKKDRELMQETGVTKKEMENVKKVLRSLEFLRMYTAGNPPVTWYDFDTECLENAILNSPKGGNLFPQKGEIEIPKRGKSISPKGGNRNPQKGEHITENTTKTRHKNTAEITLPQTTKKIPSTTKKDKEKTFKTPAARPGLEVLRDEAFILEMEEWTQGIVNVRYEMEKMCDWLSQGGKRYKDYKAFCRNWLRRACERVHADWKRQQPKQVALDKREVDDVLRYIQDRDEYNRSMGLV